jgi:hypothetical protein
MSLADLIPTLRLVIVPVTLISGVALKRGRADAENFLDSLSEPKHSLEIF